MAMVQTDRSGKPALMSVQDWPALVVSKTCPTPAVPEEPEVTTKAVSRSAGSTMRSEMAVPDSWAAVGARLPVQVAPPLFVT